jgi:hypothetical protein
LAIRNYLSKEGGSLTIQQRGGGTVLVDQLLVDVVRVLDLIAALKNNIE